MPGSCIDFKIANIIIRIETAQPVEICVSDPAYESFISEAAREQGSDLELKVDLDGLPDLRGMSSFGDAEDEWDIYTRDGDYFVIKKQYRADIQPLWVLQLRSDFERGTLYCRPEIAEAAQNDGLLENPLCYPLDTTLMMYRLTIEGGVIVHAAGIEIDGRTYIFPGKSGAGKSTISRQFSNNEDVICLSDDRIIVRKECGHHIAYGTPWPSDVQIAINRGAPLAGIVFLSHATENSIRRITSAEALQRFIPTVSIPWYDRQASDMILSFCDGLLSSIPLYEISFCPGPEVADFFVDTFRKHI